MSGEFFLWGGFVFSTLAHLFGWLGLLHLTGDSEEIISINACLIGGVSLCAFGYLLFS